MSSEFKAYYALHEACARLDSSNAALLRISGADYLQWLQGQVTNDVERLPVGGFLDTCFCTATGQLEAVVRLWRFDDYALVGGTLQEIEAVESRIDRFVVMEDVESVPLNMRLIRLQGPHSQAAADSVAPLLSLPSFHSAAGGLDLWFERDEFDRASQELSSIPMLFGSAQDAVEIEAGIPRAGTDWHAKTLAAEMGPHFNRRTVSLEKGCYVGQEVLMRIASRGHTNREWVPLVLSKPSEAGAAVSSVAREDAGMITRSAVSPRLGPIASAMLRNAAAKPGTKVHVNGSEAIVAEFPI